MPTNRAQLKPARPVSISVAIPCVNYDDFLRVTLPRNVPHLAPVTVITSAADEGTIDVAKSVGVNVFLTDEWKYGGPFNKGRALNAWLETQRPKGNLWMLALDADIVVTSSIEIHLSRANPKYLYSARRRMCETESDWTNFTEGRRSLDSFCLNVPTVRDGRVWGDKPTSNPAALCGYFQAWNPDRSVGMKRFPECPTAEEYDVRFALSFPDKARFFLDDLDVLHLGPSAVNWHGRISPRWVITR